MIEHLFSLTEIFARLMSKSMRPLSGFFARLRKKRGQILRDLITLTVLTGNNRIVFEFPEGEINDKILPAGIAMIFIRRHRTLLTKKCKMVIS
jgi:hypothetical protein